MTFNALVVDDSRVMRHAVSRILKIADQRIGEIYQAGNGREGLLILETCWVDIVLADIHMPEMDGIRFVEEMGARGLLRGTPVVIISTEQSAARIEELKGKGISGYLTKPFTPEQVRDVLQDVLRDCPDGSAIQDKVAWMDGDQALAGSRDGGGK